MKSILTSFLLLLCVSPLMAQGEPELKRGDLSRLSKPFGSWLEAKIEGDYQGAIDARAELDDGIVKVDKRLKGRSCLSLIADWEVVLDSGRSFSAKVKKGKFVTVDSPAYVLRAPKKYSTKISWPLLIVLPGSSVTPEAALQSIPEELLDQCVALAPKMSDLQAGKALASKEGRMRLIVPISQASMQMRIDRKRIYLLGLNDAASDAAQWAVASPSLFAAYSWSGGGLPDEMPQGNLAHLPNEEHADSAAAVGWLLGVAPRSSYPLEMDFQLTTDWSTRFYWMQITKWDTPDSTDGKNARMKVSVDQATNTIRLDAEFIYQVDVYLNDVIVDLDKPITFIRNGEEYVFEARRSVGPLLEFFGTTLDSGAVFPAKVRRLTIPTPEK